MAFAPRRRAGRVRRRPGVRHGVVLATGIEVGQRGAGAEPPQTIIFEPVQTAVWFMRSAGAPAVAVGDQELPIGSYCPPVLKRFVPFWPPQTIIFVPVHTAVWVVRAVGAPTVDVVDQESATGSYSPPVFKKPPL